MAESLVTRYSISNVPRHAQDPSSPATGRRTVQTGISATTHLAYTSTPSSPHHSFLLYGTEASHHTFALFHCREVSFCRFSVLLTDDVWL